MLQLRIIPHDGDGGGIPLYQIAEEGTAHFHIVAASVLACGRLAFESNTLQRQYPPHPHPAQVTSHLYKENFRWQIIQ